LLQSWDFDSASQMASWRLEFQSTIMFSIIVVDVSNCGSLRNSLGVSIWLIRACGWLVFQIVTPHDHSLCIYVWVMSIRSTIKHVHDD
jgi:hypothetical protein